MRFVLIPLLLAILTANSIFAQIIEKDGICYKDDKVFTGVYEKKENGGTAKLNINNGKLDGLSFLYFENGEMKEQRSYKNGIIDGQWITWNEKKKKMAEANYIDGKKHGKWFIWDENGTMRYEMNYANGQRIGKWTMWDESGKLLSEQKY